MLSSFYNFISMKMKNNIARLLIFLVVVAHCSCKSSANGNLTGCDSLVVQFNQPGTMIIDKTVNTTERNAIAEISEFTSGKGYSARACPLDGNILFYKKATLLADISFSFLNDSCRQFIQQKEGKLVATALSNKAADFLLSLRDGRNAY
jgi:hypothetical protein